MSQVRQSHAAIDRSRTMLSASRDRLDHNAATLRRAQASSQGDKAARPRQLAADALQGAHEADQRREQLQQLAEQWSEQTSVVTLHQLLAHAASVLTELARTEQDIADTFTSLARHDGSPRAAKRRQLAKAAAADAQYARNRARDLHQLARTIAVQEVTSTGFLDSRYTVAWHSQRSADGVGAVLASRWPLGEVAEVDLHVTDRTWDFPWAAAVVAEVLAPVPFPVRPT